MRLEARLSSIVALFGAAALGCGDEVGSCEEPRGLDTVLVDNTVQFGGQAIMNKACAGCHGSKVKGAARRGAPAGLDFDLYPVDPGDMELVDGPGQNDAGQKILKLKGEAIAGLKERQRRIFEERHLIWQQVKDELMPPPGKIGSTFRVLSNIVGTNDRLPCQRDVGEYADITQKSSRDVLRKWLACAAPVVETNTSELGTDKDNASYGDGGFVPSAGGTGYQYLVCSDGDGGVGSGPVSFEDVYQQVISKQCIDCHPGVSDPALDSVDKAYAALVTDKGVKCQNKPYVTPGDPARSFFYELVSQTPACSQRMPQGGMLSSRDQQLIRDWIAAGAKREAEITSQSAAPVTSMDAGMRAR